jgi:hypothetical protein
MSQGDFDRVAYLAFVRGLEARHTTLARASMRIPTPTPTKPDARAKSKPVQGKFDSAEKALKKPQDEIGNFEMQLLMSTYNQAETLASSMQRKIDQILFSTTPSKI